MIESCRLLTHLPVGLGGRPRGLRLDGQPHGGLQAGVREVAAAAAAQRRRERKAARVAAGRKRLQRRAAVGVGRQAQQARALVKRLACNKDRE